MKKGGTPIKALLPTIFLLWSGVYGLFAQTEQKEHELRINEEVIKMIQFDFSHSKDEQLNRQTEVPVEKKWLQFRENSAMPRSLIDTTTVKKITGYIRLEPYTIWTKFGEDPIYDVIPNGKKKEWAIHWSINTGGINANQYQGSGGVGVVILFDFNKLLYENFTKRGRAIKHNRKHANAWKTYSNYLPTISDRLKLPTFYNAQQAAAAYNTTDTVTTTVSNSIPDSIKAHTPVLSTKKVTQQESSFEDYIHKQMIQDSIRRKDFFQKDKDYRNVYDIEKQIRKMKE